MAQSQAGYTILELTITGALLVLFAVTMLSFTCQQRAVDRRHAAYTHDLLACRRAMDSIVADVRCAAAVEKSPGGITLRTDGGAIRYVLESGRLERWHGNSCRRVATGVADLSCRQDHHVAHVRLVLCARREVSGPRRQRAIETSVALRLAARKGETG